MTKIEYRHLIPDERHQAAPAARGLEICWRCGKPIKVANTIDKKEQPNVRP